MDFARLFLISIENNKFEIIIEGIFRDYLDNIDKKQDIEYQTKFSSDTIKKFQDFQK
jgi:hypothetical protein